MIDFGFLVQFNMFGAGFLGAIEASIIWFLFVYGSARVNYDKPVEHVIEFLIPPILLAFFLTFFGVPDVVVGTLVIGSFLISIKYFDDMALRPWLTTAIKIAILMFLNNQFGPEIGKIMLYFLIGWIFVENEINNRKKIKKEKNKEKKD